MKNTPKVVVFDLDGTLVDSVPDLAFCIDEMMQQLGLPKRGELAVRYWMGSGIQGLVKRALTNDLHGNPSAQLFQKAFELFKSLYAEHTYKRSSVYPGVDQCLTHLKTIGIRLVCVTNKAREFAETLLKELSLYGYFDALICGDSLPYKKPHPFPLQHILQQFDVRPQQAMMVGDSINDIQAARAAHMPVACVSYGYNHGNDIREHKPDFVVDTLTELNLLFRPVL